MAKPLRLIVATIVLSLGAWGLASLIARHHAAAQPTEVLLAKGTYAGVNWYLWAQEQGGTLCMSTGTGTGPAPDKGTEPPTEPSGGQCTFSDKYQGGSYYFTASADTSGIVLGFGPLPDNATQIRLATKLVVPSRPLPSGKDLPGGRFWVYAYPQNLPAADGTWLDTAEPLDAQGSVIPFQNF
jgi:hypothetical protein